MRSRVAASVSLRPAQRQARTHAELPEGARQIADRHAPTCRDDEGFFVGSLQESHAFMNAGLGIGMGVGSPSTYNAGCNAGKATYSEFILDRELRVSARRSRNSYHQLSD